LPPSSSAEARVIEGKIEGEIKGIKDKGIKDVLAEGGRVAVEEGAEKDAAGGGERGGGGGGVTSTARRRRRCGRPPTGRRRRRRRRRPRIFNAPS
jgi:hypothetical protein